LDRTYAGFNPSNRGNQYHHRVTSSMQCQSLWLASPPAIVVSDKRVGLQTTGQRRALYHTQPNISIRLQLVAKGRWRLLGVEEHCTTPNPILASGSDRISRTFSVEAPSGVISVTEFMVRQRRKQAEPLVSSQAGLVLRDEGEGEDEG
jgi:hypothetical protein